LSQLLRDLHREHDLILKALAALQLFAARHVRESPTPREDLGQFVLFFELYLDRWHHAKEEILLFPAMIEAGISATSRPMGCMLREHEEGRSLVDRLAELASEPGELDPRELARLGELGIVFTHHLAHHISVENQTIYPMAERELREAKLEELAGRAAEIDADWGQLGVDLQRLGGRLVDRFGSLTR
jgi:hemerythrin-like domain-containing protein